MSPSLQKWLLPLCLGGVIVLLVLPLVFRPSASADDEPSQPYEAQEEVAMPSAATPSAATEQEHPAYADLLYVSLPDSIPQKMKQYEGFIVSFNKDNRTPNYVAWELLRSETEGPSKRSNAFWQDEEIENCPTTKDYSGSGYDRGHMCPAADQKWSQQAMNDCFSMANMCPQDHDLNGKAWQRLETLERRWAQRDSAIVIVAGPIYDKFDQKRIGQNQVRVPSAFFKAILAPYAEKPEAVAFVYPNMKASGQMRQYAMTVDQLEELIGYDLFHHMPQPLQDQTEANLDYEKWNL